jgi:amino acid adenylation domain-containing protein
MVLSVLMRINDNRMKTEIDFDTNYGRTTNEGVATFHLSQINVADVQSGNDDIAVFHFDEELKSRLHAFIIENDATLFITLLASFGVLLHRYNHQQNILVKSAGGELFELLHDEIDGQVSFCGLLDRVKTAVSNAAGEDQFYRKNDQLPKTLFVMDDATDGLVHDHFEFGIHDEGSAFDLVFLVDDSVGQGVIRFSKEVYTPDTANQMLVHYQQLLYSIMREPYREIGKLPMLTPAEELELLKVFNDTSRPYEADKTLVDIFERQVAKTPDNIALYLADQSLSYGQLNTRANKLARHLISRGVQKEDNVGLLVTRDFDMVTGMFAILKCGAAYVPVTPDYPADRQQYIFTQSDAKFVLSDIDHSLGNLVPGITCIDLRAIDYDIYDGGNLGIQISSRQLAYTIYTSGSTGVPKGVMVEHHSVINLVNWVNTEFSVGPEDRLLFITSIGFDLSVYDVFGMLSAGGALVIARKEDVLDVAAMKELMQRHQVTFWDSVPSTLDYLVNHIAANDKSYCQTALRLVFLSGDWIPLNLPAKIRSFFPNAHVVSLGGATEGTVWSNYHPADEVKSEWRSIPYGKPITNNAFYILNDQLQPVPCGVIGELFIGGVGVARGYANDPEKSRKSFMPDPFNTEWGGRMYRTGDLGRMLPNGVMELVGRKDSQVKIRGYRVELGEIEHTIRQCETVGNAVVLFSAEKKQLVSYVVPGRYYDRDTVIAAMRKKLPDYMIPDKWMELDALPLTTNGKIDAKALKNIDVQDELKEDFVAPRNDLERRIAAAWQKVLNIPAVSIHDNFFNLGGQSLMAVELITEMRKNIDRELPVNILYKYPTIAQLHAFLMQDGETKKWKSLVAVKPLGNKVPMYIVHGDGLSLSNFHNLADYVDKDQPVFSLQPVGLNGSDEPLENIADIARHYVSEMVEHNPDGPYALGGYSFGGYIAIEMKKHLEAMGKKVKMLAIFDTNAENVIYKTDWVKALPKRIKRQVPKFLFIAKSMFTSPMPTIRYQYTVLSKKFVDLCYTLGIKEKPELIGINKHISKIDETHLRAFRSYQLTPFDDKIHLFKAKSRVYFVDDFEYLGWTNYARGGVAVYEVPGDHRTMFERPNVSELARLLQNALDKC